MLWLVVLLGGVCVGARRRRSRGLGRPEAAPSGRGLDAGEQRRRVSAQARAAGWVRFLAPGFSTI
jgi:hypothetical protein